MIWLISISLAAICNSLMDSVENEHFFDTRFRGLSQAFWYKRTSWQIAKKILKWKFDAWHTAKSLMILFIIIAVLTYEPVTRYAIAIGTPNHAHEFHWLDFMLGACAWNFPFNLFYNKIFKR